MERHVNHSSIALKIENTRNLLKPTRHKNSAGLVLVLQYKIGCTNDIQAVSLM